MRLLIEKVEYRKIITNLNFKKRCKIMSKKKEWICLIVGFLGAMLGLYGVVAFSQFVLTLVPHLFGFGAYDALITVWASTLL